jgi:hypothetical protein
MKNLRDKHLVHDENSWTQCETGAIVGGPDAQDKIVKVVSLAMQAKTLDQANYSNLHLLLTTARDWVRAEYDRIATDLSRQLEAKPYDELVDSPGMTCDRPGLLDPGVTR